MKFTLENTYFTTLAIDKFISIFKDFPETNFIVLDSFNNLANRKSVKFYAFVIMKDHLHIVWQISDPAEIEGIITSFKKHTGKLLSNYLADVNKEYHANFISQRKDRKYKIWKLTKGNILIHNMEMLNNKVRYIHNNPIKGNYKSVDYCCDFYFSSANAYAKQTPNFRFLTVLNEVSQWC